MNVSKMGEKRQSALFNVMVYETARQSLFLQVGRYSCEGMPWRRLHSAMFRPVIWCAWITIRI